MLRQSSVHHPHAHIRTRSTGSFRTTHHEPRKIQQQTQTPPHFSVIICTHNRRNLVLTALASLRKQTLASPYFEIIVVDNASSDGTFNAIQTYLGADFLDHRAADALPQIQCLLEQRPGLAYARATGVEAALGDILVFVDDDALAEPHFLEHLYTAYAETQADAIGGCVELRWETQPPYWLTQDFMELLGYYVPFRSRTPLPPTISFSNSCFSIKRTVLQQIGGFSPFLSKRPGNPITVEVVDLCRRLHYAGYTLWYEPQAIIVHRVSRERMNRTFLIRRAYWQGRSEVLAAYTAHGQDQHNDGSSFFDTLRSLLPEIKELFQILFLYRFLLYLARKPMSERVYAVLAQAHCWGRIQQRFLLSNHAPATSHIPFVFVVKAGEHDAALLLAGLKEQGICCNAGTGDVPLSWLWRHRAYPETAIGVIHLYQPGAFNITYWQQQRLLWKLWLAQRLGICIVSTDAGGWWNNVRNLQFLSRRYFERQIFSCSQIVHTFVRRPEHFYAGHKWYRRAYFLAFPGLRGSLSRVVERSSARTRLGLRDTSGFVYLCFVDMHSEQEIIHVIEAFSEMRALLLQNESTSHLDPQLLLIGMPRDKALSQRILTRAALNPTLHIFLERRQEDMPIYLGAANALIMPYHNIQSAGVVDLAMLFYSYERLVILPDLPRFYGLLPPYARLQFNPTSRSSLVQALLQAPNSEYHHSEKEATILNCTQGWKNYAGHIVETYRSLLTLH